MKIGLTLEDSVDKNILNLKNQEEKYSFHIHKKEIYNCNILTPGRA